MEPRIAVAVVTMGNRPAEVDALLESVAKQDLAPARIVIVGNGCRLPEFAHRLSLPGEVTTIDVEENLGCPGGRNVALARLREFGDVDVVVELDDDGLLVDPDVLRRVRDLYAADPRLGIVGFRIADERGETQQRHVPRIGKSDPLRGGYVTGFLGGGHALRMAMLAETGDWPAEFFFAHEETDLAWRAADAGWKILYAPELLLQHPKTSPARHAIYYRVKPATASGSSGAGCHCRSSRCTSGCGRSSPSPAPVPRRGSRPGSAGSRRGCGSTPVSGGRCAGGRCGGSPGWDARR